MTHNNYNNNNLNNINVSNDDGIDVVVINSNDHTNSLEQHVNNNKTSDNNNTSLDEKCQNSQEKKSSKKRKHRRGKKKRHLRQNPYGLSNSEYEKIECEKIQRNRDKMAKQGKTLAPFNTTQFIMDEHRNELPVFDSVNSSDMDSDTTAGGGDTTTDINYLLSNEFNEEYEIAKLDYYRNLNKEQLLKECFDILSELNKSQETVSKLTIENIKLKEQLGIQQYQQHNGNGNGINGVDETNNEIIMS